MTDLEILMVVRGLIGKPEQWTQKALARNCEDRKVSITHPHACKFSLEGAFYRVQYITQARCGPAHEIIRKELDPRLTVNLEAFNNALGTTHYVVLKLVDRTIRLMGGTPPVEEEKE